MNDTTPPIGATVRWHDRDGGWRFGRLEKLGRKWAKVRANGLVKEIAIDALLPWPPPHDDDNDNATPPPARVRRGE